MDRHDDEVLLHSVQQGESAAIEEFYRRYSPYLFAVANRYLADTEAARDILQESFVKIFSTIKNFKPKDNASIKSWMTRIVVNDSLNLLRNRRLMFVSVEDIDVSELSDDTFAPDSLSAQEIQQMIKQLPNGYRTVFNLFAIERLSHKEIAAMLGITESTSASQYLRANKDVKTDL